MLNFSTPACSLSGCGKCSEMDYAPICGGDGKIYFSPCHAGCEGSRILNGTIIVSFHQRHL